MVLITGNPDGSPAVDYTVNAAVGFPWVSGPEGYDGPVNHVLPAWDAMTGFLAAVAILVAERHRRLTGMGQLVELSLSDVAMAVTGQVGLLGEAILNDEPRGRNGNYVYGTFERDFVTRDDRQVMVLALTPRQWRSLCEAAELTDEFLELQATLQLDFVQEGDRWRGRRETSNLLAPWIANKNLSELRRIFDRHGVLWGPYQTFKQLVAEDSRASTANPLFARLDSPGVGPYLTSGSPLRFGAVKPCPPRTAPSLGQHTEQVLNELRIE